MVIIVIDGEGHTNVTARSSIVSKKKERAREENNNRMQLEKCLINFGSRKFTEHQYHRSNICCFD